MVTSLPPSASTIENAVPHEPAPKTATLPNSRCVLPSLLVRCAPCWGCRSRSRRPCACRTARRAPAPHGSPRPGAVMAAMIRSVASCTTAGVRSWPSRSLRSTGSPTFITIFLRGNRSGFLAYGASSSLRAPLADRDHRAAGLERDPGGAGLARHRPQVGVAGDRALGVDHDALALARPRPRRRRRRPRRCGEPLDRDLAGRAQEVAEHLVLEQARLREVARQPAVVVDEVGGGQRVDVRDVVERDDAAAGGRDLLAVAPLGLGGDQEERLEDRRRRRRTAQPRFCCSLRTTTRMQATARG